MAPQTLSLIFALVVLGWVGTRLWLASRQMRHVHRLRDRVPEPFAAGIPAEAHRKAADYTVAKTRLGLLRIVWAAVVLLAFTLLGGLDALNLWILEAVEPTSATPGRALLYQVLLVGAFMLLTGLADLPLDAYGQFVIDARYGFNRATWGLWWADLLKGTVMSVLLGGPILLAILWVMGHAGRHWWLAAWAVWMAFTLLMLWLYPSVIAPLYNRFTPMADGALRSRVQGLLKRCGFAAQDVYVMDGSRRSAHANAYFTGLGRAKRVVLFDTLLEQLNADEVEAVLAHELGHHHHRHVGKRIALQAVLSLAGFALLGWLARQPVFYAGLGVAPNMAAPNDALALILMLLAVPPVAFFLTPWMAARWRRQEFEADAFALRHADGHALRTALLKLHRDNASTLTPDPMFVRFYYSHPPAAERLAALPDRPNAAHQARCAELAGAAAA